MMSQQKSKINQMETNTNANSTKMKISPRSARTRDAIQQHSYAISVAKMEESI